MKQITSLRHRARCQRLVPRARLFIMARSVSRSTPEAGDTAAVEPRLSSRQPRTSAEEVPPQASVRQSLLGPCDEESRYGLLARFIPRTLLPASSSTHRQSNESQRQRFRQGTVYADEARPRRRFHPSPPRHHEGAVSVSGEHEEDIARETAVLEAYPPHARPTEALLAYLPGAAFPNHDGMLVERHVERLPPSSRLPAEPRQKIGDQIHACANALRLSRRRTTPREQGRRSSRSAPSAC